jgi:hypothetical protein
MLALQEPVADPPGAVVGPSGDAQGYERGAAEGRGAFVGRGGGGRWANKRNNNANFYSDSDNSEDGEKDKDNEDSEDREDGKGIKDSEDGEEEEKMREEREKEMDVEIEVFQVGILLLLYYGRKKNWRIWKKVGRKQNIITVEEDAR